jgi:hypothetical protein
MESSFGGMKRQKKNDRDRGEKRKAAIGAGSSRAGEKVER